LAKNELVPQDDYEKRAEILHGNVFGFVTSNDLTVEEKIGNLLAEIPLALLVVDEARSTISRLRDENAELKKRASLEDREDAKD
jgi:PII-like signaling protein